GQRRRVGCGCIAQKRYGMTDSTIERHPFLQGLSKHRGAPPTIIVIFGASGDLTSRKLIPAIYNLGIDNLLPADFRLIGYGRREMSDEAFRESALDSIRQFSRRELNPEIWKRIEAATSYFAGAYDDPAAYKQLHQEIASIEKGLGREVQAVFYLSTPPSAFKTILDNLGGSGLAGRHRRTRYASKVVIEKPFGNDLESARKLNSVIMREFDEQQVYRID